MFKIIKDCRHISLTDWGTYACSLYSPYDTKCIVQYGTCEANKDCPYKRNLNILEKIEDICKKSECSVLATEILEIIKESEDYKR